MMRWLEIRKAWLPVAVGAALLASFNFIAKAEDKLPSLHRFAATDREQKPETLAPLIERKTGEDPQPLGASGGAGMPSPVADSGQHTQITGAIRSALTEMEGRELQLLDERQVPVRSGASFFLTLGSSLGIIAAMVLLLRAFGRRGRRRQDQTAATLSGSEKRAEPARENPQQVYFPLGENLIWRAISESTLNLIYVKDVEGRVIFANPAAMQAFGKSEAEIIGKTFELPVDSSQAAQLLAVEQRVLSTGQASVVEETLDTPTGPRTFLSSKSPCFDKEGKIIALSSISTDISERKSSELAREGMFTKARQARAEAEAATRAKDEFLALVAHELRSPLGAIRGWIHVLANIRPSDTLRMQRALDGIKRNTELQTKLVEDLLDVGRIISGQFSLEKQPLYIKPLLEEVFSASQAMAEAKGVQLSMMCKLDDEKVSGDAARLSQAVHNLLSNAIKFTSEGGRIELAARRHDNRIQVSVSDTGVGIAAEKMAHIFARFLHAEAFTRRRQGGLGVGLAVVQRLVELHGGTVQAESGGEGKGATFTIALPLYNTASATAQQFTESATDEPWDYQRPPVELHTFPGKHPNNPPS